jgi:hypothetical protein
MSSPCLRDVLRSSIFDSFPHACRRANAGRVASSAARHTAAEPLLAPVHTRARATERGDDAFATQGPGETGSGYFIVATDFVLDSATRHRSAAECTRCAVRLQFGLRARLHVPDMERTPRAHAVHSTCFRRKLALGYQSLLHVTARSAVVPMRAYAGTPRCTCAHQIATTLPALCQKATSFAASATAGCACCARRRCRVRSATEIDAATRSISAALAGPRRCRSSATGQRAQAEDEAR